MRMQLEARRRLTILGSFARRVVVVERAVRRNLRARCGFFERCALVWGGGGGRCGRLGAGGGLIGMTRSIVTPCFCSTRAGRFRRSESRRQGMC